MHERTTQQLRLFQATVFAISSPSISLIVVPAAVAVVVVVVAVGNSDKCSAIWRYNDPHYEALLLDDSARCTKTKEATIVADNGHRTTTLSTSRDTLTYAQ